MFCEHEVLNHNNLCLFFKSLIPYREEGWSKKKRGIMSRGKFCLQSPNCVHLYLLFVLLALFSAHSVF